MIAGYVSVWLLTAGIILIATGWKDEMIGNCSVALAALFIVPLTVLIKLSAGQTGVFALLPIGYAFAWALSATVRLKAVELQAYLYLTALLTAAAWIWIRKLYWFDPVFVIVHPQMDAPLIAGLAAVVMSTRFREQFAVLALTSLIGEYGSMLLSLKEFVLAGLLNFDSRVWLDSFLMAMMTARLLTALSAAGLRFLYAVRKAVRSLLQSLSRIRG